MYLHYLSYRSVKHQPLRLMVFGDAKTGKTTLIERLKRRRPKVGRLSPQNYHGISIKQWSFAPSSSDKTVNFRIWEFADHVSH